MLTLEVLKAMSPSERGKAIFKEKIKCAMDFKYMIETYFTVDAGGTRKAFKLYPHQKTALKAYLKYPNNITMKTRQMGFTTFTSAFVAACMVTSNNFKTLIISKEMGSSKDFLKNIKDIIDNAKRMTRLGENEDAPSWLIPDYKEGYNNKESFELENGSYVKAQGNTEDAGRGISGLHLAIVDEVAFIDRKSPNRMNEIWAAIGPALSTVQGKAIMISTPKGSAGWYYDTYTNAKAMGFNIIDAHWTVHPLFNRGQYQWISDESNPEGGYVKFYNETWPDTLFDKETGTYIEIKKSIYNFRKDGKIRSPWYDFESSKLGPAKTACELDCNFMGTGGEVLEADMLRAMKTYAESISFTTLQTAIKFLDDYTEFEAPQEGHRYVVSCDVATGDGSDTSTITILNMSTLKIAGTFKANLYPNAFATVIAYLGYRFNKAPVVVENAGGGGTTLQELKEISYPNIYYSTLNKKDETLGVKKRKIGLWISEDVRKKGGDKLELMIRLGTIVIPCQRLVEEFYTWIWDKDGKRRHAPGKHDDLIMSLQHAVFYYSYVYKKHNRHRENFMNIFERQTIGGADSNAYGGSGIWTNDRIPLQQSEVRKRNGFDIIDQKNSFFENGQEKERPKPKFF